MAVALLCAAGPARADQALDAWAQAQSALCTAAIGVAEQRHGIPPGLLLAIAKAESGRPLPPLGTLGPWPWTIDVAGAGAFYDTQAAAMAGAAAALQRTRNVDVGCLQISLLHHPRAFNDLHEAFDPGANAAYAARFLVGLAAGPAAGDWWLAAGYYHSQTPALAAGYRLRVEALAAGRPVPRAGLAPPLYSTAVQRGRLRLVLAGGAVMVVRAGARPVAACQPVAAIDGAPGATSCARRRPGRTAVFRMSP